MADDNDFYTDPDELRRQMKEALNGGVGPGIARFALACLGGLIPVAGGAVSGAAGAWSERDQAHLNKILAAWVKLQEEEMKEIGVTMIEVMARLNVSDEEVMRRVESPEFLSLVRKCFRDWSAAESEVKRGYVRNLLTNAAACRLTSDDVIRLFIQWINDYSEAHFAVIKDVYGHPASSRGQTWQRIHGASVREDSAEADLFKLLYRDLSTGGIIRQVRQKDGYGNSLKEPTRGKRRTSSPQMVSAFDDRKPYGLTELGNQFVHYTMNEIVPKIVEASG